MDLEDNIVGDEKMKIFNIFKEKLTNPNHSKGLNAFSDKFNINDYYDLLEKIVKDNVSNNDNEEEVEKDVAYANDFIEVTNELHKLYDGTYKNINQLLQNIDATGFEVMSYALANDNRNLYIIYHKYLDTIKKLRNKYIDLSDLVGFKLESSATKGKYIEGRAALEGSTDTLNALINYLRYFSSKQFAKTNTLNDNFAGSVMGILSIANTYVGVKSMYDTALYEGGFARCYRDREMLSFFFDNFNHKNLLLQKAGDIMMQQRIVHVAAQRHHSEPFFLKYFSGRGINTLDNKNGKIEITIGNTPNYELINCEKDFENTLLAYYEYLQDEPLPKIGNILSSEVFAIWYVLQYIAQKILVNIDSSGSIYKKEDFGKVPQTIAKEHLINIIKQLTIFERQKIESCLQMFVSTTNKRSYVWTAPLYDVGDSLLFPLFPILHPQDVNLVDYVLSNGGVNLDIRGKWMERYALKHLQDHHGKYECMFWGARKFKKSGNDSYEEIDLLVSLKLIVVVCELKCIHYSMEPSNYREAWKRLKVGCEQVLRKAEFVKNNIGTFKELGDYSSKEILPVVITNYPTFTGFSHNGVFITDIHSFLAYMEDGVITLRSSGSDGLNTLLKTSYLYDDEDQFSNNLYSYLSNNPIKDIICKRLEVKEFSLDKFYDNVTFSQMVANFKNNPELNIDNSPE